MRRCGSAHAAGVALFTALAVATAAHALPLAEEARFAALLERVATARDTVFIRNGARHSAANAAEFLRRKCAPSAYASVRLLIAECASRSSTTGQPYLIRIAGNERPGAEVLLEWLAEIERGRP